jgi:aminoglycoside 2'-N-acetyltransferase I
MSIEIEVLNGDASWATAEPLFKLVWPQHVVEKLPWGHIEWAHADLRVLIDAPSGDDLPGGPVGGLASGLACHVGIHFRTVIWNGRKFHIGGIGGVSTRADCRGKGYASIALNAAIRTMRDHEALEFALLFCEPHNFAFYQSRGWHPFEGEIYAEQPSGRIRFEAMAPFVFDLKRAPRQGSIDLCGLPW